MHSRVRLLIIPACAGAVAAFGPITVRTADTVADARQDSIAVAKAVNDFHNALSKGDSATALRLLSNDVVILESGGVETRSEYRSHHLPADIEFAKAVSGTRGPIHVSVKGTIAWTSATSVTKGEFKGRAIDSTGAESMVLTKDDGHWHIRSVHWSSRRRTTSS